MENKFRSGFAVLLGPTNAGKSTLLNALMGEKISIVSNKPQTTYHGIRGILTTSDYQIVFTDTPGLQSFPQQIPRLLNKVAENQREGCDASVWVFDVSRHHPLKDIERLRNRIEKDLDVARRICVLNKVDQVNKEVLLPLIAEIDKLKLFGEIFPISAKKGANVDALKRRLVELLPEGPQLYDTGTVTDRPQPFRVAELIREKIYHLTHEEIPYSVYVNIEDLGDVEAAVPTIHASLCVDTDSKKGIVIGKAAEKLKRIGMMARTDIEKLVGKKICLKLHVKVDSQWTQDATKVQRLLELS